MGKATETRGGGEALRAAIKRVNPNAEMLDTSDYIELRKKVKKAGNNANTQDKINLFVNAIARRDGEGVEIYRSIESEKQYSNEDEKSKLISDSSKHLKVLLLRWKLILMKLIHLWLLLTILLMVLYLK